jgi:hypothetical protein
MAEDGGQGVRLGYALGGNLADPLRRQPGAGPGYRERGHHGAAVAVDGGGHGHEPGLQLTVDDGVPVLPHRR